MAFLGGLAGLLLVLFVVFAVASWPVTIAWHLWSNARRAHRRAQQRPRQPYDDGYQRALWDGAYRNGQLAAERDLRALEQ